MCTRTFFFGCTCMSDVCWRSRFVAQLFPDTKRCIAPREMVYTYVHQFGVGHAGVAARKSLLWAGWASRRGRLRASRGRNSATCHTSQTTRMKRHSINLCRKWAGHCSRSCQGMVGTRVITAQQRHHAHRGEKNGHPVLVYFRCRQGPQDQRGRPMTRRYKGSQNTPSSPTGPTATNCWLAPHVYAYHHRLMGWTRSLLKTPCWVSFRRSEDWTRHRRVAVVVLEREKKKKRQAPRHVPNGMQRHKQDAPALLSAR